MDLYRYDHCNETIYHEFERVSEDYRFRSNLTGHKKIVFKTSITPSRASPNDDVMYWNISSI